MSFFGAIRQGGLVVSALVLQAEGHGLKSHSDQENFQTVSTPSLLDVPWVEYSGQGGN